MEQPGAAFLTALESRIDKDLESSLVESNTLMNPCKQPHDSSLLDASRYASTLWGHLSLGID